MSRLAESQTVGVHIVLRRLGGPTTERLVDNSPLAQDRTCIHLKTTGDRHMRGGSLALVDCSLKGFRQPASLEPGVSQPAHSV